MMKAQEVRERVRERIRAEHGRELTEAALDVLAEYIYFDEVKDEGELAVLVGDVWKMLSTFEGVARVLPVDRPRIPRMTEEAAKETSVSVETGDHAALAVDGPKHPGYLELQMRTEAYTAGFGALAGLRSDVQYFRRAYLGDKLLALGDVDKFVRSLALRFLSLDQLEANGISVLDHHAEELEGTWKQIHGEDSRGYEIAVRVTPPGVVLKAEYTVTEEAHRRDGKVVATHRSLDEYLPWQARDGKRPHFPVAPHSVISELRFLGRQLAESFPWHEQQGMVFVLTGVAGWVSPVRSTIRTRARSIEGQRFTWGHVFLELAPWVPTDYVAGVYDRARQQLDRSRRQRDRPLGERIAKIFIFVVERVPQLLLPDPPTRTGLTWNELREQWDTANPEMAFGAKGTPGFWRAFNRARAMLFPDPGLTGKADGPSEAPHGEAEGETE